MKKLKEIIITGIATLLISNCPFNDWEKYENWYKIDDKRIENLLSGSQIRSWEVKNIKSVSDQELFGRNDYWGLPKETLNSMKGDCEDKALLDLAIWKKNTGNEGSLAIGYYDSFLHAEPDFNGNIYCDNFKKEFEIPFDEIPDYFYYINQMGMSYQF